MIRRLASLDPLPLVELFIAGNLGFLAVDIAIAHAINRFAEPAEWVPLVFSIAGTATLTIAMLLGGLRPVLRGQGPARQRWARGLGLLTGWGAIGVGVAGFLLHLESHFFDQQTLRNLVYTAPFAAPLSYAGLGLLLILDRTVDARGVEWARWVVLLALGGFVGNFVLTLADHAQNGFFNDAEWGGVIAAAVGVGLLTAVLVVYDDAALRRLCLWAMGLEVAVGVVGAYFHAAANLRNPSGALWEKFLYGAPAFAPLLFANLAVLAALGLWALGRAEGDQSMVDG